MTNQLNTSDSPYLLQHAHQDVAWHEWSESARTLARETDRPLFISIGYATCHWCHVMSHESFDDAQVAALLNEWFVPIKIDREERPDVDQFFMTAAMTMGKQGGWPLTIVALPDGRPFYAATYLPKESRPGMTGLMDLLPRIHTLWTQSRPRIEASAADLERVLTPESEWKSGERTQHALLIQQAFEQLERGFDERNGGFGDAPKFPSLQHIRFLIRLGSGKGAREMVSRTLSGILHGGIWDHVDGGLHRYSTDASWHMPHFEKMLYDQAGLLRTLAEAYAAWGDESYRSYAADLLSVLERRFMTPDGLFYAALDADSEGVEGLYHTWSIAELEAAMKSDDLDFLVQATGVEKSGRSVLDRRLTRHPDNWTGDDEKRLQRIFQTLRGVRDKRESPFRDEKILVDWNGMLLGALAATARYMHSAHAESMAGRLGASLWERFRKDDGQLLRRGFKDATGLEAQLDDYAWFAEGLLEMAQVDGRRIWVDRARSIVQEAVARLWDADQNAFYVSNASDVPVRMLKLHDEAYESGASIMLRCMRILAVLDNDHDLELKASRYADRLSHAALKAPSGFTATLSVLLEENAGRGELAVGKASVLNRVARSMFAPHLFLITGELLSETGGSFRDGVPDSAVQVCRNRACDLPVTDPDALLAGYALVTSGRDEA